MKGIVESFPMPSLRWEIINLTFFGSQKADHGKDQGCLWAKLNHGSLSLTSTAGLYLIAIYRDLYQHKWSM